MAAKKFQYKNALNEIEQIVDKIENEEIDIDELSELVKRAAELIKMCKTKLRTTGQELDEVIDKLEE
jgi:exodeoxyribonuclease VII small subunit